MDNQKLCLVCDSKIDSVFFEKFEKINQKKKLRTYYFCKSCEYIYLKPSQRLTSFDEKKRYLQHNNDTEDPRYVKFLSSLYDCSVRKEDCKILDFGSGPTESMKSLNSSIESYDPFFFNDKSLLSQKYDLIFCSEVVEHFYNPKLEFQKLKLRLEPKGRLAIRTGVIENLSEFSSWKYRQDETHVGFFRKKTFEYLAEVFNWKLTQKSSSIFLLDEV